MKEAGASPVGQPPQTGRGTPFFCFHAAFTEHEKKKREKKNGPHHAEFLTPVPPTSNTGVVAHLRGEHLLREGGWGGGGVKAVLDGKSDGPGCAGYFRPVVAL